MAVGVCNVGVFNVQMTRNLLLRTTIETVFVGEIEEALVILRGPWARGYGSERGCLSYIRGHALLLQYTSRRATLSRHCSLSYYAAPATPHLSLCHAPHYPTSLLYNATFYPATSSLQVVRHGRIWGSGNTHT